MKNSRAILAALLAIILVFSLGACKKNKKDKNTAGGTTVSAAGEAPGSQDPDRADTTAGSDVTAGGTNPGGTPVTGEGSSGESGDGTAPTYNLNVKKYQIELPQLPHEVVERTGASAVSSKIRFTELTFETSKNEDTTVHIQFTYTAEKTADMVSDTNLGNTRFVARLIDKENNKVVATKLLTTDQKKIGDLFENYGFNFDVDDSVSYNLKLELNNYTPGVIAQE